MKEKWQSYIVYLRRPGMLVAIIGLLGLVVNGCLAGWVYQSAARDKQTAAERLERLQTQVQLLEHKAKPEMIQAEQLEAIAQAVPKDSEIPRFLDKLHAWELAHDVVIQSIENNSAEQEVKPDNLANLLKSDDPLAGGSHGNTDKAQDSKQEGDQGKDDKLSDLLDVYTFTLSVQGGYEQVYAFLAELGNEQRLLLIPGWQIQQASVEDGAAFELNAAVKQFVTVTFDVSLFSASAFSSMLPDEAPIDYQQPQHMRDTEDLEHFLEDLKAIEHYRKSLGEEERP